MAFFNSPGFIKLWFNDEFVETKYNSIQQIPLIGLDKKETFIPKPNNNSKIAILHYKDSKKCQQIQQQLKKNKNIQSFSVADQNSSQTFDQIRQNTQGNSFGKMILNGPISHPLFRYLKKNCDRFRKIQVNSAAKITQNLGLFVCEGDSIKYYKQKQIKDFLEKSQ